MNNEPIPGSTNHEGIFTAKNPYKGVKCNESQYECVTKDNCICAKDIQFNNAYPPLPCYSPDNNLVIDKDVSVTGPVWRAKIFGDKKWEVMPKNHIPVNAMGVINEQVYLTVQPTEKAEEKQTCLACGGNEFDNKLQAQLDVCGKCLRGEKLKGIAKTDSGWLDKAKAKSSPSEHLDGVKSALQMVQETPPMSDEDVVNLMEAYHTQLRKTI